MKQVWIDGSTTTLCYVIEGEDPQVRDLSQFGRTKCTVNEGEYFALIAFLQENAQRFRDEPITILSDSELMVKQLNGEYKVKEPRLRALHIEVKLYIRWHRRDMRFVWIPREENLAGKVLE